MNPASAHAPGRVELLGNHTDYNEGRVLSAAISFGTTARGETLPGGEVVLTSDFSAETVNVPTLDHLVPLAGEAAWANYPLGVAKVLADAGHRPGGFRAGFTSDLPAGAGLSSSAAIEVATGKLLMKLFGLEIAPMNLAKLCRRAENEFVGVPSGLLDQVSSIFGRRGQAVTLDCRTETVGNVPLPAGVALLVFHTNVPHRLVGGEYAERREQCFEAARRLGVRALRDVSGERLAAVRGEMADVLWRRAAHIVGEDERVVAGTAALRRGDGRAFGELMFQSHESSRLNFENSTPELDLLVALARETPGVLGSRLTGGGFGGATISLVEAGRAEAIGESLGRRYAAKTGFNGKPYVCEAADGAA